MLVVNSTHRTVLTGQRSPRDNGRFALAPEQTRQLIPYGAGLLDT